MMGKNGVLNGSSVDEGSAGIGMVGHLSRHRSLARRVIFPSLHRGASPSSFPHENQKSGHNLSRGQTKDLKREERGKWQALSPSPTNVENIETGNLNPPLLRSTSLDGITIPLPKLSLKEDSHLSEGFTLPKPLNQRPRATRFLPAPPEKQAVVRSKPGSSSFEKRPSKFFGERKRTYYPAVSIPTAFSGKKSPSRSKPLASILKIKSPHDSCMNCGGGSQASLSQSSQSSFCSSLSPTFPTLASPASIKSLHRNDSGGQGQDGIGESEYGLDRISDFPKMLPRKEIKMRRNQSDTIRRGFTGTSSPESNVSRHVSLECLAGNKRIKFDPHITVYEFYETAGGKWWSEDELTQFKQEAIQRIRLRSTRVLPTGTGRALAVTPEGKRSNNERGKKAGGNLSGSVLFNHPALGCDDEVDPESRYSGKSSAANAFFADDVQAAAQIRNILVVDPHEIFLSLFTKSLNHMVPHASVATARSAEDAMTRIESARSAFPMRDGGSTNGFDIIIIEERLRAYGSQTEQTQAAGDNSLQRRWDTASGTALIQYLVQSDQGIKEDGDLEGSIRFSLLVGVSAHISTDRNTLEKSGADCVWGKPPPEMNAALRNKLLELLTKKRNRRVNK